MPQVPDIPQTGSALSVEISIQVWSDLLTKKGSKPKCSAANLNLPGASRAGLGVSVWCPLSHSEQRAAQKVARRQNITCMSPPLLPEPNEKQTNRNSCPGSKGHLEQIKTMRKPGPLSDLQCDVQKAHLCCLIPASLDLLRPQGLSGSLRSQSNFITDCFTQSLSSQALSTLVTQLCLQMNLFLASAAAQHVVKSACLFKKPHGNSGAQQYTLHFKMPLWVDFYFDSFKMGTKKPWNSQYWTEWEGWALGLCGGRGGAHLVSPLHSVISHHFRAATVCSTLLPSSFSSGSCNHSLKALKQSYSDTFTRGKCLKHSPL